MAQAASQVMNPAVDMEWIQEQFEEDPIAAEGEFNAQFRTDVETFIDRDVVESCVERDCWERPPNVESRNIDYYGFVDPAGGNGPDSMTMAVAHRDGDAAVLDCVREAKPPFSPTFVSEDFASVFKSYEIFKVTADRWGAAFVTEAFDKHGIRVEQSAQPKSDIYRELLPALMSGCVRLLDNSRLISQLCNLERRCARSGKDWIDHAPSAHDDCINAAAGALVGVGYKEDHAIIWAKIGVALGDPVPMTREDRIRKIYAGSDPAEIPESYRVICGLAT